VVQGDSSDGRPNTRPCKSLRLNHDFPGAEDVDIVARAALEIRPKPFGTKVKNPTLSQENATLATPPGDSPKIDLTKRNVETGFLKKTPMKEFSLYFEEMPFWLLALDRSFTSRVYICGFESSNALLSYLANKKLDPFLITKAAYKFFRHQLG
jgi:hypothetical protein